MKSLSLLLCVILGITLHAQDLNEDFGASGRVIFDLDNLDELVGVFQDDDGNIYFYGNTSENLGGIYPFDLYIGKMNQLGEIDPSFGVDGIYRTDCPGNTITSINSAVWDTSGIYLMGRASNSGIVDTNTFFISKIDHTGNLNLDFADDGYFIHDFLGTYNTPGELLMDAQGKLVFCGSTEDDEGTGYEFPMVGRLLQNGDRDSTFGTTGVIVYDMFAGALTDEFEVPAYTYKHGEGGYLDKIIEVNNNYYAAGGYLLTANTHLNLVSINKDGEFNADFSIPGPFIFQSDVGGNHYLKSLTYHNGKVLMGIETDGLMDQESLIQIVDTTGTLISLTELANVERDLRTRGLIQYNDLIFVGEYSKLHSSTSPGYHSDDFEFAALDDNYNLRTDLFDEGFYRVDVDSDDELGLECLHIIDDKMFLGGYMNNVSGSNFTDIVFIGLSLVNDLSSEGRNTKTLQIFPNPSRDYIQLSKEGEYKIFDLQGKLIKSGQNKMNEIIDIQSLEPGAYLIHVLNNHSRSAVRFIKN